MKEASVRPVRLWLRWLLLLVVLCGLTVGKGYWNATRDPVVRRATIGVEGWPAGEPPLKVLLLSDIHVAGPDMPPARLVKIVARLNRLTPDLVLIAGDLVSEKRLATHIYRPREIIAPLGKLRARLGIVAALGNHDHWFSSALLETELRRHGITVLKNEAVVLGPIAIGGVDDDFSGHDDVSATFAALDRLPRMPSVLVTHSPDIVPELPSPVAVVFAGHTHCGQIALPFIGAVSNVSRYGDRFACGLIDDKGQKVVVGAGLGTSILPLRYGAPPDVWLITLTGSGKRTVAVGR